MSDTNKCGLCDEPMPKGEEMFLYHGYSGPCQKPALSPPWLGSPSCGKCGRTAAPVTNGWSCTNPSCVASVAPPLRAAPTEPSEGEELVAMEEADELAADLFNQFATGTGDPDYPLGDCAMSSLEWGADYFIRTGKLEKHPTKNWYRWRSTSSLRVSGRVTPTFTSYELPLPLSPNERRGVKKLLDWVGGVDGAALVTHSDGVFRLCVFHKPAS